MVNSMKRKTDFRESLVLMTAVLVLLIAVLAGGSLWVLRRINRETAHVTAARSILEKGRRLTAELARQPVIHQGQPEPRDWAEFSRMVELLHASEEELEYVAVSRDGVTVFQEHTTALDPAEQERRDRADADLITMARRNLVMGGETIPVVTFQADIVGRDGATTILETGLRKQAVAREERGVTEAIRSMFRLSLVIIVVAFAICLLAVIWMMHREVIRERQRRNEEHLAFSGMMANGIVHDFRNPMSSLNLDVQMLAREVRKEAQMAPERVAQLADHIHHTVDRMEKVFKEFLYLSRPTEEQVGRLDLVQCVRECLDLLRPRFESAKVQSRPALPTQRVWISGYASALRRAIINVLLNAIQFAGEEGHVEVSLVPADDHVDLVISDSGPGIAPGEQKRVFEMFVTGRPQGTGLGLFLAKAAIERSGGRIRAENPSGGGARFTIRLRRAVQEVEVE
jgi:signal transduction histidine kinase